jgi:hypothetical protein
MVEEMGFHAQKRVVDHFLIFSQVLHWLRLFDELGRKSEKAEAGLA